MNNYKYASVPKFDIIKLQQQQHLLFVPSDIYSQFVCKEKRESEVLHVTESTAT